MSQSDERPAKLQSFVSFLREELAPYPGRLPTSLRVALACVLTLWIDMAFELPDMGVSIYLVFFVSREGPAASLKSAVMLISVIGFALLYSISIANIPGDKGVSRFIGLVLIIFVGEYLFKATTAGTIFYGLAIFGQVFIQQWDTDSPTEKILESNLDMWLSISAGIVCGTVVELAFNSKESLKNFQDSLSSRIKLVESVLASSLHGQDEKALRKQLSSQGVKGTAGLRQLFSEAERTHPELQHLRAQISGAIQLSAVLVDEAIMATAKLNGPIRQEDREALSVLIHECQILRKAISSFKRPAKFDESEQQKLTNTRFDALGKTLSRIDLMLRGFDTALERSSKKKEKPKFLKPDAWSNPLYFSFAFRVTAAATITWIIYKGIDWQGISTCVTTCLITALDSRGEENEKQVLRIGGDLIAGLCGFAALVWILPAFNNIAGLTVVVAVAGFLGGWAYLSSPRLNYAGRQFSYCFFLATLTSYSTPTSLTQARDRVAGVLLGVLVMWLVFDQIQPVWALDQVRPALLNVLQPIWRIAQIRESEQTASEKFESLAGLREAFGKSFTAMNRTLDFQAYELDVRSEKRKQVGPKLRQISNLVRQLFVVELVSAEEQLSHGQNDGKSPHTTAEKLGLMISSVKQNSPERLNSIRAPQQDETSENAIVSELGVAIREVLSSKG